MDLKDNKLTYHYSEKDFKNNRQTKIVLDWIENDKTVLEFGCHTGLLSKLLVEKKNSIVDGVEINKVALQKANKWLNNSYLLNIEEIQKWKKELENKKYDYILFLHVLEHLRNPQEVLNTALDFLNEKGTIIIGLPNVSNVKERFNMLFGNFEYTDVGVMDRTHYHLFNFYSATKLISKSNLSIVEYQTPYKINPLKYLISRIRFVWRLSKLLPDNSILFRNNANLTDQIMIFKCKKNK